MEDRISKIMEKWGDLVTDIRKYPKMKYARYIIFLWNLYEKDNPPLFYYNIKGVRYQNHPNMLLFKFLIKHINKINDKPELSNKKL